MKEAVLKRRIPEVGQITQDHRGQPDFSFAARQRIAELACRTEARRSGGDNSDPGEMVGGDLEDFRGIVEPVDFVQDDAASAVLAQKRFRVRQ